jgi:hypothetical protein
VLDDNVNNILSFSLVRCASYPNLAANCVMVPDSNDPQCCQAPYCHNQNTTVIHGVQGTITGVGTLPTCIWSYFCYKNMMCWIVSFSSFAFMYVFTRFFHLIINSICDGMQGSHYWAMLTKKHPLWMMSLLFLLVNSEMLVVL